MENTQIQEIVDTLTKANRAYRDGSPIMTDQAYDALEDRLKELGFKITLHDKMPDVVLYRADKDQIGRAHV